MPWRSLELEAGYMENTDIQGQACFLSKACWQQIQAQIAGEERELQGQVRLQITHKSLPPRTGLSHAENQVKIQTLSLYVYASACLEMVLYTGKRRWR
ncbi:hypothetical protein MKW98_023507 [Papaver atlanticum]|uniref:Uncharacterized protein n=1 Tax=Papaver atlanticum TaxID=357466 RepID=A0AAD4XN47_9MAGN|nr:hypothetical protein MKW98_023507 [Papaver atlanticum]